VIALDTSSLVAFFQGEEGDDVGLVDLAFAQKNAVLPPVVLSELLSDPRLKAPVANTIKEIPLLDILDGYWERVGALRSKVISKGWRAPLADALIAQNCLDHNVTLVTRDADFRNFERAGGLKLL